MHLCIWNHSFFSLHMVRILHDWMGSIIDTRVTIKDVAREAGVSIATVSRVLNKKGIVTDEMQQKVLDAAYALNYIPNTAAKSLKTNHTNTIGFLVSDISAKY